MCRMIGSILTLTQHQLTLESNLDAYRPRQCARCGAAGLWAHGVYYRQGERSVISENRCVLIPIPRFFCRHCKSTCSRLPACMSPRRWYPWSVQGLALLMVFSGIPLSRIREWASASADTVRRWRVWLAQRTGTFEFHLRSALPKLGRHAQTDAFWLAALKEPSLREAMTTVCRQGVTVP